MHTAISINAPVARQRGAQTLRWALLIALWLLALAWVRPLSDPDEGRYAVVALDMLRSGDWVTPTLNGLPFFHKPPLYYWLAAAGFSVLGVHEWVARLPSLIGAWMAAMSLLLLVRRYASVADAKAATVVLVTMPFAYLAAQYANMDMLLAGCVSACTACAFAATWNAGADRPWRAWMVLAGLFAGLGFLAKGLIGIVLPGMVWCLWLLWERRWRQAWLALYPPVWLALWLVAAPWAILAQQRQPPFFHYFFVTQHFQRYTATGFNNPQPWWFYLAVIALACLPWTLCGAYGGWRAWRRRGARRQQPAVPWSRHALHSLDRFMAVWGLVVVGFFSIPHSKIVGYVLPALPPLAYGVARVFNGAALGAVAHRGRRFAVVAGLAASLCVLAAVALGTWAVPQKARWQRLSALPVQPSDRVMMLGHLYYEVPFYLPTNDPAWVVDDWQGPQQATSDNWKKELQDAADFAPQRAKQLLIGPAQAQLQLCSAAQTVWVVGEPATAQQMLPALAQQSPVLQIGPHAVWRWKASASNCNP